MANSGFITGSFNGSNAQYLKFRCDWSVTSQSTANKTSTVSLSWVVQKTTSNLNTYKQSTPWSQTCDSSTTNGTVNFNLSGVSVNTDYVVRTDTVTISHNANGTKTASISGTLDLSGTSAGVGSFSGSMELPTIATTPPTVSSLTLSDQGTGYSTVGAYVAGFTKFKLTASATAASPATISSYAFYNGNTLLASGSSSTYTYSNYNSAGSYTFKVVVTDSYGNSTTKTNSAVTVSAYTTPTISATTFRCNSSGTADTAGAYARVQMTYSVASVGSNSAQVHKVKVGSLSDVTLTSGTAQTVGGSLSASTSYNAVYTVTDKFGTTATITQVIQSEFVNFDLYPSSSTGGMGVGILAESGIAAYNIPIKPYKGVQVIEYNNTSSVSDLNSKILSKFSQMAERTVAWVEYNPSAVLGAPFNTGGVMFVQIEKSSASYGQACAKTYSSTGAFQWVASIYNNAISSWANVLSTRILTYIDKSFSSTTIPSNGYVSLGSIITDFGMPSTGQPFSFFIRGWSGATLPLSLMIGSNGETLYVTGTPQTITSMTVRLFYYIGQ